MRCRRCGEQHRGTEQTVGIAHSQSANKRWEKPEARATRIPYCCAPEQPPSPGRDLLRPESRSEQDLSPLWEDCVERPKTPKSRCARYPGDADGQRAPPQRCLGQISPSRTAKPFRFVPVLCARALGGGQAGLEEDLFCTRSKSSTGHGQYPQECRDHTSRLLSRPRTGGLR